MTPRSPPRIRRAMQERALRSRQLDQAKLGRSWEPLDAGLLAKRGGSIGDRDRERELNRTPAARVAAGGAGTVGGEAPLHVGRPAAVQAVVGAAQQVDVRHPEDFAGGMTRPAPGCLRHSAASTSRASRDVRCSSLARARAATSRRAHARARAARRSGARARADARAIASHPRVRTARADARVPPTEHGCRLRPR